MFKILQKVKKFKIPVLLFSMLFLICLFSQQNAPLPHTRNISSQNASSPLQASVTYNSGNILILDNHTFIDNILIMSFANVTIINSTIQGNVYIFNWGRLYLLQNSSITGNIVISDSSKLYIDNSTVGGTIECHDSSILDLLASYSVTTTIMNFGSTNLSITNSSIAQISDFGAGVIQIMNSTITTVILSEFSFSRTYINNSIILFIIDSAPPPNGIISPINFDFFGNVTPYETSERIINLTWIGWDNPIRNGYLNITFQILLDGQFYAEINGSGFIDHFSGSYQVNITTTGLHNVSVVSIDSNGNNFTYTIFIEIIEYPTFPWLLFWIIVVVIAGIIIIAAIFIHSQQKRGYHSSLSTIFKKELADSKIKILIFVIIAAVPGILLFFIFNMISRRGGPLSIDSIRSLVNMVFSLFLYYFGLVFSIMFGAGTVVNAKRDGSLSWFLSKPVRRWEFLWGKIFAYLVIIVLIMTSLSVSFVLGSISFINPIYIPDLVSMGGYILIIGLSALIPLTAIVILCSSAFRKVGLTIFIPIMLLIAIPPLVSFLPIITRHEWPLLLSFSYYYEQLGSFWVFKGGGLFGSMGTTFGAMFGMEITSLNISPIQIILILYSITIICFVLATYFVQKKDIP
ncbi:MAG: ABC transporter permease subunit [Candidatus Helarchaeota archaeon]|nr:ABC transporter permease subunit [Candidatus Helarchaeota archaeon]